MPGEFLYNVPLILILVGSLAILWLGVECGFRIGSRAKDRTETQSLSEIIPTSLLGLLALLMGFTFSMSLSRFDARKLAMVHETNAIETAWLRAGLLATSETGKARTALMQYLEHRIHFPSSTTDPDLIQSYQQQTEHLQGAVWKIAQSESVRDRTTITMLFTTAVNEMIDLATLRSFALEDHVPEFAYLVIFVLTLASLYSMAYIFGCRRHGRAPLFLLAVLLSLVLGLIQDLDRPSRGVVRVNNHMMTDLRDSLNKR